MPATQGRCSLLHHGRSPPVVAVRYEWCVAEALSSPTVLLLSTSDTDLITARASGRDYRWANPSRLVDGELAELLDGADMRSWSGSSAGTARGRTASTRSPASGSAGRRVSGEQAPDADLMSHSTVPAGVALQAHVYLAQGGVENLRQPARVPVRHAADDRFRVRPPVATPNWGVLERPPRRPATGPTIAVLYYRAQHLAGNTELHRGAVRRHRAARAAPAAGVLRVAAHRRTRTARTAGHRRRNGHHGAGRRRSQPGRGRRRRHRRQWNVAHLAALDVPILQGLCLTSSRRAVGGNDDGMSPLDVATQVAVPGVRRPHHHGSVLVQGDRRRGADLLRPRPGALRPGRRTRGAARPAALASRPPTSGWRWCSPPIRPSMPASATRSDWTPRERGRAAAGDARRGLPASATVPGRRRAATATR